MASEPVSEQDWQQFVRRVALEASAELRTLQDAEQRLATVSPVVVDRRERNRLMDRALEGDTTGMATLHSLRRRVVFKRVGLAAAAAGICATLGLTLWPSERDPRDTLSLRDAMAIVQQEDRGIEARRSALVKLFSLARDGIGLLKTAADPTDDSGAAGAARAGIPYLWAVLSGDAPAMSWSGLEGLDQPDADIQRLAPLLRAVGDDSAERREAVQDVLALTSGLIVALDDAPGELSADAAAIRMVLERELRPR